MNPFANWRRLWTLVQWRMAIGLCGILALAAVVLCFAWAGMGDNDKPTNTEIAQPPVPPRDGKAFQVLFMGNSLTSYNNLSGMVQAMAAAGGVKMNAVALTFDNYSLEDQWKETSGRRTLASRPWDYVVMQQGPSSRPESQVNLREWSLRWADEAQKNGVKPALYMVWPFKDQKNGFALVSKSYRAAAKAAKARILPAGDAWQEALRNDPAIPLYTSDNLHPTPVGSYLAALVITYELTGVRPRSVPARLRLEGGSEIKLPGAQVELLRQAAEKVHGEQ